MKTRFDNDKKVGAIFMDLSKAFDTLKRVAHFKKVYFLVLFNYRKHQ